MVIYYDSEYAANMTKEAWRPTSNVEMIDNTVALYQRAKARGRNIGLRKVKSHDDIHGNEVADRLAKRGARGRISTESKRWAAPGWSWAHPTNLEHCGKCGRVYGNAEACGSHEARCTLRVLERPGYSKCRLCATWCKGGRGEGRTAHEAVCRGSDVENRRCKHCALLRDSMQSRVVHEATCRQGSPAADDRVIGLKCVCGYEVREGKTQAKLRSQHEKKCRGSWLANVTCR